MIFKKIKKILLLTIITIVPTISTISCISKEEINFDSKKTISNYKVNNFTPLDFNIFENKKFANNQPTFLNGINYTAYSQGFSFIFNILKGLGWNWEDEDKIKNLYDNGFNFNSIDIEKDGKSLFLKNKNSTPFEKWFANKFNKEYTNGVGEFIEKQGIKLLRSSFLYNQIKKMHHIGKDTGKDANKIDIKLKVDSSTGIVIKLDDDFSRLDNVQKIKRISQKLNDTSVVNKIFQNQKYAYSWSGTVLRNFGFQIQDNKIIIWHMSESLPFIREHIKDIRYKANSLKNWISTKNLKELDQKNLSQIILDPLSANGSMGDKTFYTHLNLKHSDDNSSIINYLDIDNIDFSKGKGEYDWSKSIKGFNNKKAVQTIIRSSSFINGDNPGTVILKMYEGEEPDSFLSTAKLKFKYPLKTFKTKNRIQTFYKITQSKKKEYFSKLIIKFLDFIKSQIIDNKNEKNKDKDVSLMRKFSSPNVNSLFEFIKNNDINLKDINKSFNKYNNGSHYMLAVEIFLRGMKNIPPKLILNNFYPDVLKLLDFNLKQIKNEIVGMSNTNNLNAIIFMAYTSRKKDEKTKYHNFKPSLLNYDESAKSFTQIGHFLDDLSKYKKIGSEDYK